MMKPRDGLRLFHFSDDGTIDRFVPRATRVPVDRPPGDEWLNGPLVWAIDGPHRPMYLFPRECPRILVWRLPDSARTDVEAYLGRTDARIVAFVERCWLERIRSHVLHRYELPTGTFRSLGDAGMWVSDAAVRPSARVAIGHLPDALRRGGVDLRVLPTLEPLRDLWRSSLHVSGIRLRNAAGWVTARGSRGEGEPDAPRGAEKSR